MADTNKLLQLQLDNAKIRNDNLHIMDKLSESAKELSEIKLRHAFELDELKLTYEEKLESVVALNANLQQNVDKYQNKVLELHSVMKGKDDSVVEMKKKLQENTQSRNIEKKNYEKNIEALQNELKAIQLDHKELKAHCEEVERTNSTLNESIKKCDINNNNRETFIDDRLIENMTTLRCSNILSVLELSESQLQIELKELHKILKEKSRTIRELRRRRNECWGQYRNIDIDSRRSSSDVIKLENDIKNIELENDHLKNYCKEVENSKAVMADKLSTLENNQSKSEDIKEKEEVESLRELVYEKEDTIKWIETKMMETFASIATKTTEYEDKLMGLESEIKTLKLENDDLKEKGRGNKTSLTFDTTITEERLAPADGEKEIKEVSSCSKAVPTVAFDTPKLIEGKQSAFTRMFSKSFRKFIRERNTVKDTTNDNEMFYISEKDDD